MTCLQEEHEAGGANAGLEKRNPARDVIAVQRD